MTGTYHVYDVSNGRVIVGGGDLERSDVMRAVMICGREPCRELRGCLSALTAPASDSSLRFNVRAKFNIKVSREAVIWEARVLRTVIRLVTNSVDSHVATVSKEMTTQAKNGCKLTRHGQISVCCI